MATVAWERALFVRTEREARTEVLKKEHGRTGRPRSQRIEASYSQSGGPQIPGTVCINLVMPTKRKQSFHFPRTTLLFEIERRCAFPDCDARNQIGLTKQEAIEYRGFDCFQCERWNEDRVSQLELPDSWAISN